MKERLEIKFPGLDIDYTNTANTLYKLKNEVFGAAGLDAQNLLELCGELKKEFPDFFYKHKISSDNRLSALFFSTPAMRSQYQRYKNVLILDTTFGTNRFKLPLMFGTMINNMGRTIIAFISLISSETSRI